MKCSFTVRKTADNRRKDVSFISFEEFVHVLDNHSHRHIDECRFLFQCATAARVSNTFNLKEYSEFVPKKCKKCLFFQCCDIIHENCFHHIKFTKTKTDMYEIPLLPQILSCFQNIKVNNDQNLKKKYDKFLFEHFKTTSHSCRKFLPNFFYNNKEHYNCGGWANKTNKNITMQNYYLTKNSKFILLYHALVSRLI